MSVAVLPLGEKYGWSDSVKGAVSSAFNLGHTLTNFYGGYLASAYSPKLVLSAGVVVWSAFTVLTPPAAVLGLTPLILVRAFMGLGEGVAYPTMQAIIKGWVPLERRSRSLSLMYSGHQIGSILSLLWSPLLISSVGVDAMFYVYGLVGFAWLAGWEPLVSPHPPLLAAQAAHEGARPAAPMRMRDLPWRAILTNRVFWALLACHSTFGILYNTAISWLPRYYNSQFGLDVRSSSFLSVLPWVAMALGTNLSGWAADFLINRKLLSPTKTRKLLQLLGSVGPAVCLLYLAWSAPGAPAAGAVSAATHGHGHGRALQALGLGGAGSGSGSAAGVSGGLGGLGGAAAALAAAGGGGSGAAADVGLDSAKGRQVLMDVGGGGGGAATAAAAAMTPEQQAAHAAQLRSAVVLLVMTLAFLGLQAGGFASTHQDISTRLASVLFGTTNASASLAGSGFVLLVGIILDATQSWALVFQLIAGCCLASAALFTVWGSSEPQFE